MSREALDRSALRELLGLRPEATDAEMHETYRELDAFLAPSNVPRRLQKWAARERASAARVLGESRQTGSARPQRETASASPASPRRERPRPRASDLPDFFEEDLAAESPRPRRPSASQPAAKAPVRRRSRGSALLSWRSVILVLALGVVVAVAVMGSPLLAGLGGQATPISPAGGRTATAAPLDQARVAELVRVVQANPSDTAALFELGEMHFQADLWQESIDWFTKLLAVDPTNTHARTDVGTASYNLGRYEDAKNAWEEVARRDPTDAQVHYNLGFLYANSPEPSLDKAIAEWQKVIDLAPDSTIAQTARTHLGALKK